MRGPAPVFLLLLVAAAARGQGSSDFQQSQVQPAPNSAGGSDFNQTRAQPYTGGGGSFSNEGMNGQAGAGQNGGGQNAGGQSGGQNGGGQNGGGQGGDEAAEDSGNEDAPSSAMPLADARVNFATVVEAYVAKNSAHGFWPYEEKKGGKDVKIWRLKLPSVADKSVEKQDEQRYSGLVKLRDARGGRTLTLKFVVDFSGARWKVVSVKPAPAPGQ
jgi:hypothetical protein